METQSNWSGDNSPEKWRGRRWAGLLGAILLLNVSLAFGNIWPTPGIKLTVDLSLELAACLLALMLSPRRPGPRFLKWLAVAWVALIVGHYAELTSQALYGRQINLYWDMRHMSAVGTMLAIVSNPWLVVAVVAGFVLIPVLLYLPSRWALVRVSEAAAYQPARRVVIGIGCTILLLFAVVLPQEPEEQFPPYVKFATPVVPTFANQARLLAVEISGAGVRALVPPPPIDSTFHRVEGADVFAILFESYGAASWDRPELAAALAPSRTQLEFDIRDTGREVVSAFAESPTFGGGSWLAHVSLLSGVEVRDDETNVRLMAQRRDTMVTPFTRHGYRAVAIMPGMQQSWPEGEFYGFQDIYGAEKLDYTGPKFGWWDLTDQFAIARMDALVVAPEPRSPVFVFLPTVSTHTPFAPTPPYQPDWGRMLQKRPYDWVPLEAAWSDLPDWENLGPSYARSVAYTYASLGGYLQLRSDRDIVMIVIGDHQPPALVTGAGASWEVPVHVITSRRDILDRLVKRGFRKGLAPQHPSIAKMHELMPIFFDAFDDRD